MYEAYDAKTGELVRVDLYQLEHGFANGTLVSSPVVEEEKPKRTRKPKAEDDENQG